MVIDFRKSKPVNIRGEDIEVVQTYKFLGVHLDDRLDWAANTDALYKRDRGEEAQFFDVRTRHHHAAVCWSGNTSKKDTGRSDRLVKKACFAVGRSLESMGTVVEWRMRNKFLAILDNVNHPLHHVRWGRSAVLLLLLL